MKRSITFYLAMALISIQTINVNCKNDAGATTSTPTKRDTTQTLVVHMTYGLRGITYGPANRIVVHDSMPVVQTDSVTWKKKKTDITYYQIVLPTVVDSVLSKQYRVPLLDSLGNPTVLNLRFDVPPIYVRDTISDLNKAIESLKQYIVKPDSTINK
jgi:hypothetical protein